MWVWVSWDQEKQIPIGRTHLGVVQPNWHPCPLPTETSSSSGDPATSLSLSLPGADVSEDSTNINTLSRRQNKNAESFLPFSGGFRGAIEEMGKSFAGDGGEFMVLVQEMINAEVRSYMAEMQRDRNGIVG